MRNRGSFGSYLAIAGILTLVAPAVRAAGGTAGASFLNIPVGAEPAAFGSAYTARATDAYAPVWNPAGLGFLDSVQFAGQHLDYLESMHYEYMSMVLPFRQRHGVGFSAQYLGSGDIARLDPNGDQNGDFSNHYSAYTAAYGLRLGDKLALGASGRWIQAKLDDVSANAFASDLGVMYRASKRIQLAAVMANLGNKLTFLNDGDALPLAFRVGGTAEIGYGLRAGLEGVYSKESSRMDGRCGLEWSPIPMLALRAGYRTDILEEQSAMAGVTTGLGIRMWGHELAYAFLPHGDLGNTHYISLRLGFGEKSTSASHVHLHIPKGTPHTVKTRSMDVELETLMALMEVGENKEPLTQNTQP